MNSFTLRIDGRNGYDDILTEIFKSNRFIQVLCVQHEKNCGNNIHYHATLTTDYKHQALRVEFKRHFTLGKGNSHMSLRVCKNCEQENSYMFYKRPSTTILFNKLYTLDEIDKFKEAFIIKDNILNTPKEMCKVVLDKLIKYSCRGLKILQRHDICFAIWDYYKDKDDWFPDKLQMDRYISKIECGFAEYYYNDNPGSWNKLKETWFSQMYPDNILPDNNLPDWFF